MRVIYINDLIKYLYELASKRKLYKGQVIGITGSAGKTTLKETLVFFLKKITQYLFHKKVIIMNLCFNILLNLNLNQLFQFLKLEQIILEKLKILQI